ncbi:hypothetical protein D3C81_1430030 [compost metagenome]
MRALRTCKARYDRSKVKLDQIGELWIFSLAGTEHALGFVVGFNESHLLVWAACAAKVVQGLVINREVTDCGTIFRSHVSYGCTVSKTDIGKAWSVELYEFTNNAFLPKHLCNCQGKVCCCCAFSKAACELEADNFRSYEIQGLPKHTGFGFNTADTPTYHT